ncbi:pentraxin-related protein PTX3 [Aplochiton taeniatus]
MFPWRLPQTVCLLLACTSLSRQYEYHQLPYEQDYNAIPEGELQEATPSPAPCRTPELTKWDKMFSMLENSQMRENMLLQYADDIIKVELGSLRGEMLRFVAQYGGACGVAVEAAGRKLSQQMEARLRENLERLNPKTSASSTQTHHQAVVLQQLLSAAHMQSSRLAKVESSCLSGARVGSGAMPAKEGLPFQTPGSDGEPRHQEQEVTSESAAGLLEGMLAAVVTELKQTRAELELALRSSRKRNLPAGCETALLFPMRSRRIYTSVVPDLPLSLSSFTVCLWARPLGQAPSNRTVLFSYGTPRNPYEIQLLLSGAAARFTVGGEAHLVEGRDVVQDGPAAWVHLCGAWSSEEGLATLWADGRRVASTPGVAEGHVLPAGGSLQLGQEREGSAGGDGGRSGVPGFEGGFDAKQAFAGKMTGVNVWDRVLAEDEIGRLALPEGEGCERRGNVVAWAVTEMVPHGGAQFIN